jgi:hypothetical protein
VFRVSLVVSEPFSTGASVEWDQKQKHQMHHTVRRPSIHSSIPRGLISFTEWLGHDNRQDWVYGVRSTVLDLYLGPEKPPEQSITIHDSRPFFPVLSCPFPSLPFPSLPFPFHFPFHFPFPSFFLVSELSSCRLKSA